MNREIEDAIEKALREERQEGLRDGLRIAERIALWHEMNPTLLEPKSFEVLKSWTDQALNELREKINNPRPLYRIVK